MNKGEDATVLDVLLTQITLPTKTSTVAKNWSAFLSGMSRETGREGWRQVMVAVKGSTMAARADVAVEWKWSQIVAKAPR